MALLSVISTVYNGSRYLEEYFSSMLAQSLTDYELILIDDGSTDGSGFICDKYAGKDPRIRVYHQENQGLAASRNNALDYINTDWITFVDCDDVIHPRYLEVLYQGVIEYKVSLSGVGVLKTNSIPNAFNNSSSVKQEKYNVNESMLIRDFSVSYFGQIACAKLINKSILKKYPFTNGRVFEDNAVVKKWLYEAGTVVYAADELYFYRVNNEGLSMGSFSARKVDDVLWSRDEIIDFYKEKGLQKAYEQAEINYILFAINLYFKLLKVDRENAAKLKKRILKRYKRDRLFIDFSKDKRLFILELKYPKLMWLYWKIKDIM